MKDIVIGSVFFLVSFILLFFIIPANIAIGTASGVSTRFFPQLITSISGFLSLLLIMQNVIMHQNFFGKSKISTTISSANKIVLSVSSIPGRKISLVCVSVLYLFAMNFFGYYISSVLFLAVVLYIFGEKRIMAISGISVGAIVSVYLVFGKILNLLLPRGIIFLWLNL